MKGCSDDGPASAAPAPPPLRYPHHLVEDRVLEDGRPLRVRPIMAADRHRHWRFVCSLSLQSRYHRLMSARHLLPGELRRMVEVDYDREMAVVAVLGTGDVEEELGVARYVRNDNGPQPPGHTGSGAGAEFAIVVADAWQRRGIGQLLLSSLINAATAAGIDHLGGLTLATNVRMIRLAKRLGFEVSSEPGDWTVRRVTWRQTSDRPAPRAAPGAAAAEAPRVAAGAASMATQ